jgi:hypothetical protein
MNHISAALFRMSEVAQYMATFSRWLDEGADRDFSRASNELWRTTKLNIRKRALREAAAALVHV